VLVSVSADHGRLRVDLNVGGDGRRAGGEVVGGNLDNQFRGSVLQRRRLLPSCCEADYPRGFRRPADRQPTGSFFCAMNLVALPVLLDPGADTAHAVRTVHIQAHRRLLAHCGNGRLELYGRRSGHQPIGKQANYKQNNDYDDNLLHSFSSVDRRVETSR
jgi:hypothetical protein